MNKSSSFYLFVIILFFFNSNVAVAQLTAPGSAASVPTSYPVFPETDSIFIFCTQDEVAEEGALQVQTNLEGTKTFLWEKYNNESGEWEFHLSEIVDAQESAISSLPDGGYRITITQGESAEIHRAWVFNNWLSASANITESTCEYFQLAGSFLSGGMRYYDLQSNEAIDVSKNVQVEWKEGERLVSSVLEPTIYEPPTKDTDYTLRVYDRFGCEITAEITYESIVPKAEFTVDPQSGEAPLIVTFNNQSENADPGLYEWFFYRDLNDIKRESEGTDQPVDSIMLVAYDDNPVFTFENSGLYKVKLVAKHASENRTCVDTAYIQDFIEVDTSFVAVPNVFTPNGDGTNDLFVVKFWSMRNIKISIFNRWGKRIHFWDSGDVRGFENTWMETVWDGRINGRFASPGVYYYTVEGTGRDDEKRRKRGFFHLFRGKD
ncbi:MAG: gliding motility-associated C-terminal domain-containing protein [Prolixibacteraceae bacterium]